jgi:hypothetical protein
LNAEAKFKVSKCGNNRADRNDRAASNKTKNRHGKTKIAAAKA